MSFFETVDEVYRDWNYDHPKVLYGLIRSIRPAIVINCGTFRGLSAAWMAKACQDNNLGTVYCLDNWSESTPALPGPMKDHCIENLTRCGVMDRIQFIDGDTDKVEWPSRIDFAYIDAWHGHKAAFYEWSKCVAAAAECVCFDDTTQSVGPRLLMQEIRASGSWDVIDVDRDCGLGICMRRKPLRPITFSQELLENPGVDLTQCNQAQQDEHFKAAELENGIDYAPILGFIHAPKS